MPDYDVTYRPRKLSQVIGQDTAVAVIRSFGDRPPRSIMFSGPSGTGKTTLARIVASEVLRVDLGGMDLREINCASISEATQMVRDIESGMSGMPMMGSRRVWILDEVQSLSRATNAQQALLTVVENCPPHCQFFFCTTDPSKLHTALRGRLTDIPLRALTRADLLKLISRVSAAEGLSLSEAVQNAVVARSDGAARNCVKLLELISKAPSEELQLEALDIGVAVRPEEFDLVKALNLYKSGASWEEARRLLSLLSDSDPESLRCFILASARKALLANKSGGAWPRKVIEIFSDPMDDRRSGAALLAARVWEACHAK